MHLHRWKPVVVSPLEAGSGLYDCSADGLQ
jgi:hypothetical protein